jgi:hypothetical protein
MKTSPKAIGTLALVLLAALASGSALAQHRGHGGYGHGYGYGGNVHFGISLGVPLYGLGYYPAPYYAYPAYPYPAPVYAYPPVVMGSSSPPVYVEQGIPQGAPAPTQTQAQGDWYYCAESRTYYPYVAECPAGWQRVPAQPPSR